MLCIAIWRGQVLSNDPDPEKRGRETVYTRDSLYITIIMYSTLVIISGWHMAGFDGPAMNLKKCTGFPNVTEFRISVELLQISVDF